MVFSQPGSKRGGEHEATIWDLHAKIAELTVGSGFFSARVGALGRAERTAMVDRGCGLSLSRQCELVGDQIKAGTCFLIHFDIAHAALSNRSDSTRYMLKFICLRRSHPVAPSWDGGQVAWRPPKTRLGRYDHNTACSYVWDWMRGAPRTANAEPADPDDVHRWMKSLNSADQPALLEAIYEMAAIGADAIAPLRESLLKQAGQDREFARR